MDIKLEKQVDDQVAFYAACLGTTPEKLVNDFLFIYLDSVKEILKCPDCGAPVVFTSLVQIHEGTDVINCPKCGRSCLVDWENNKID